MLAQHKRYDQEIPRELYEAGLHRTEAIKNAKGESEWSGTYYDGDHHPTMFMWSLTYGFLVTSSLHTFSPSWLNYGKVTFENGLLTIFPELPKEHPSAHIMRTEFKAIRWDKQHFLIAPGELIVFAYAVHSKSRSQVDEFFLKSTDRNLSRRGLPDLPAEYSKYLKMKPIRARILSVSKIEGQWSPSLTIDAGRHRGMVAGILFYHVTKSGLHISIRVDQVSETTATAYVASSGSSNDVNDEEVKPGWVFSNRMPAGFIEPD